MAKFGEFHDTKNLFIEYTGYTGPLTYEEWLAKPDNLKAGLLFIQFYSEITLAWEKADTINFGDDAEGVTTILQYLQKHVSHIEYYQKANPSKKAGAEFRRQNPDGYITVDRHMIEEDPKKFSSGYIYRVAYNCLYCICGHDRKCDKDRIANETSSIAVVDGEELNLFDTIIDWEGSVDTVATKQAFESEFWSIIESEGATAEKVMRYLLNQDPAFLKKLTPRNLNYDSDPLRDIEVSIDQVDAVLRALREKFLSMPANSQCGIHLSNFDNLFSVDESLIIA